MPANYPATLPTLTTNKADGTLTTTDHKDHHNQLAFEINAIATELGTDVAGLNTTLKTRVAVVEEAPLNVKDARFGAVGDGTEASTAINAAIDLLPQTGNFRGGRVLFPPGDYLVDGAAVDAIDKVGVTLMGVAGPTQHQPRLLRTSATGSAVTAGGSQGFTMRGLRVHASSATYSGDLVDFGPDGTGDASLGTIEDCWISGVSGSTGRLVVLDAMTEAVVRNCSLQYGNYGIVGWDGGFCNSVAIEGNTINFMVLGDIRNPGQAWAIRGNSLEPLASGAAGGISNDYASLTSMGVIVENNWFGDASSGTGSWIDIKANGLMVTGNFFESPAGGGTYIKLRQCEGYSVVGNKLSGTGTGIDFVTSPCPGGFVGGNDFQGLGTVIANETNASNLTITGNDGVANFTRGVNSSTDYTYAYRGTSSQIRIGEIGGNAGVLFHSNGDAYLNWQAVGVLNVESSFQFPERADPSAPAANKAVLYAKDNGSGKTQLAVRFSTGAVQILATEP